MAAGSGISSGSRRRTTPRRFRSPTASSTGETRAGRPTASASPMSATKAAILRSGCSRCSAVRAHRSSPRQDHRLQVPAESCSSDPSIRPASRRRSHFGARQRRPLACAFGCGGCMAMNSTIARSFPSEVHYFHCPAEIYACSVKVRRGQDDDPRREWFSPHSGRRSSATSSPASTTEVTGRTSTDNDLPADFGKFLSADLHVHMNYGGHYRSTPETLLAQQDAEDLDVVYNLHRQQGRAHPGHRLFQAGRRRGSGEREAHALPRAGVPHELLGPHGTPAPRGPLPAARLHELPTHGAREPLAAQRRDRGPRACTGRARRLRARRRFPDRSAEGEDALLRAAGRRRPRQGATTSRSWASRITTSPPASGTAS